MKVSRRAFLGTSAGAAAGITGHEESTMQQQDGPVSPGFHPVPLNGTSSFAELEQAGISELMRKHLARALRNSCVSWGIPFDIGRVILLKDKPVIEHIAGLRAQWLVFLHTADHRPLEADEEGFIRPMRGEGLLNEKAADYVILYADGSEERHSIRRRHEIGMFRKRWGENCFQCVPDQKPFPVRTVDEQPSMLVDAAGKLVWGQAETRNQSGDVKEWLNWLWAWENPHPEKEIVALRFEPASGMTLISAVSAGMATSQPLRWQGRRKAILRLPKGTSFDPRVNGRGLLKQIQLDMGQVILAEPRKIYPEVEWPETYNNKVPEISTEELLIEYAAHPDARFHLEGGRTVRVTDLEKGNTAPSLVPVPAATQRVTIRVVEADSGRPVPVKLHIHGTAGEYLAPVDRHRQPNTGWFDDFAPEFQNQDKHYCTYIPGETVVDVPPGKIYVEVSKGFEIRPVRKIIEVKPETETIEIPISKVLHWREKGWVTADTHVHFLSPATAMLEGKAEGVNVVNLLASQWGEMMTNVGDFDGKTTFGAREAGGDGEWLVRVGTENRQHVLGHISLLGYNGNIIAPMCAGGPDESAIGNPIGVLLADWAERCRAQGGLAILPHFPDPRCEGAADVVAGLIDGIEMTSWGNLYGGIDPYSLSDYYRYLNCGYVVPAVGGTDKMAPTTAVGTIRTYAHISSDSEFTYQTWMDAVRSGNTFITYGPLLEFAVEGRQPGSTIRMKRGGGTVEVTWKVASITIPMSRVELMRNGEVHRSLELRPDQDEGHWSVPVEESCWLALLVRGHYPDRPEIITAHSSPVMIMLEGSPLHSAADAVTILDQIEGALAYLDTVGNRAEDEVYKRLRLKLTSAYRTLHNRLHQQGHYHEHSPQTTHPEHER